LGCSDALSAFTKTYRFGQERGFTA
jgi:hypothetical protein